MIEAKFSSYMPIVEEYVNIEQDDSLVKISTVSQNILVLTKEEFDIFHLLVSKMYEHLNPDSVM